VGVNFNPADHPRGRPENSGQFAEKPRTARPTTGDALRSQATPTVPPEFDFDDVHEQRPIFVYGTLREGHGNSFLLAGHQREEAMIHGADMFNAGVPYLRPGSGTVYGEVCSVSDEDYPLVQSRVDALEGYSGVGEKNLYDRAAVTVVTPSGPVRAYVYVGSQDIFNSAPLVESGDWNDIDHPMYDIPDDSSLYPSGEATWWGNSR
jgi:gamma-glutamylcyclotransferase (GGCT)/AIG2-like uncharacterized protein YtfP